MTPIKDYYNTLDDNEKEVFLTAMGMFIAKEIERHRRDINRAQVDLNKIECILGRRIKINPDEWFDV